MRLLTDWLADDGFVLSISEGHTQDPGSSVLPFIKYHIISVIIEAGRYDVQYFISPGRWRRAANGGRTKASRELVHAHGVL